MPQMIITKTMGRSFLSIFLIFLLQNSTPLQTASAADKKLQDVKTIEEMVVTGSRIKKEWERQYKSIAGKRIFTGPYGESKYVIAISQELKNRGKKKRVFTRGIKMPHEYTSSSLDRYHYPITDDCDIDRFKFYQGDDFTALGYIQGSKRFSLMS